MTVSLLEGHVVDVLAGLPAGHFHVCVTSPPYWQLRHYGTEPQVWQCEDGDALCAPEQHEWGAVPTERLDGRVEPRLTSTCIHCGSWRGEYGQEPTPELYLWHTVMWARAVRRVLRDDGTLFVNIAGMYWSDPGGQNGTPGGVSAKAVEANAQNGRKVKGRHPVYKPLDYVDIPGLVARALQEDGWLWRADITWVKPSPLPESVSGTRFERCRVKTKPQPPRGIQVGLVDGRDATGAIHFDERKPTAEWADCPGCPKCDHPNPEYKGYILRRGSGRPTKSTEAVLLFAKKANYFYDTEAVREPNTPGTIARLTSGPVHGIGTGEKARVSRADGRMNDYATPSGRNQRDAWIIGPEPLKDEHYAAFPTELVARCIKAGSSERGCCPSCGAPWARVVERTPGEAGTQTGNKQIPGGYTSSSTLSYHGNGTDEWAERGPKTTTLGWRQTCACPPHTPRPAVILDPFGGSGTTGLAANRLGRDCTLIELKSEYAELARKRVGREPLSLFAWQGLEALASAEDELEAQKVAAENTYWEEHAPWDAQRDEEVPV